VGNPEWRQWPPATTLLAVLTHSLAELQSWFDSRQAQAGSRPDPRVVTLQTLEESRLTAHRRRFEPDVRPGGIISGPALVAFVDAIAWMMAVAHQPYGSDALTLSLSMQFLRAAPAGELTGAVEALRIDGRTSVVSVTVRSPGVPDGPVAHAVVTLTCRPATP